MIYELVVFTLITLIAYFAVIFFINKTVHQNGEPQIDESSYDFKSRINKKINQYEKIATVQAVVIYVIYCLHIIVTMWSFTMLSSYTTADIGAIFVTIAIVLGLYFRQEYKAKRP